MQLIKAGSMTDGNISRPYMPSFEDLLVHPYPCTSLPGLSLTNLTIPARTPSLYFTDTRVYVSPAAWVYYKPLHVGLARPSPT